jgi:hypothetical protein
MFSALLFLQYHSIKNRTGLRLRRLKQPKYLVGAIVGVLYFYFYFFRYLFGFSGHRPSMSFGSNPEAQPLYEALGAAIFLIAILLAWVLPNQRAALSFTEAEVAFLFPAPISRRGLIHFKLLRSQAAILFTTLILMLVTNRFGGKFWIHAAGWWLILSAVNLHLLGSSFIRTTLLDRGITNWKRRLVIVSLLIGIGLGVVLWARRSLPAFDLSKIKDFHDAQTYIEQLLTSGPLPWLLYPFRLLVRPYLAPNATAFFLALGPALGLVFAHYWWVARANVAFEEASVEASKKTADRIAALRSGQLRPAQGSAKARRPPFALRSTGSPTVALLWKNLISAGRIFTARLWLIVTASILMVCVLLGRTAHETNLLAAIGMAAGMLVVWSMLIGPQILRQDLRQDLPLSDILKLYPIRGWEVALGELLAPVTILTGVQWLLLLIFAMLFWNSPSPYLDRSARLGIAVGAALIVPLLNLIVLQIPNAAVLLFPAWFQPGKERTAGIEVTGQRIISIFAQFLVFILAMIPATIAFGAVFFLWHNALDRPVAIVFGSVAASFVLAIEAALGIVLLGWLFERFDISAELPVG